MSTDLLISLQCVLTAWLFALAMYLFRQGGSAG
jgi:hypothetical protein